MTQHIAVFDPAFPIAKLRPGHMHPLYPANPRKGGHEISLPELMRSIHEQGVLQPLRAFPCEDGSGDYWVNVGERRLLASQKNQDTHADSPGTVPVLLVENITPQEAFHDSLTEQLNRLPLHPIDQYEAFAELKQGGMDEAAIAAHYGVERQVVRQRIALGKIAPDILKAWRGEAIDLACAQEFTRLADHKDQMKLFNRLRKNNSLFFQSVRAALVPDQGSGARFVEFVGLDAYRARGGAVYEDLFNGIHGVSDAALAAQMAQEKLEAEALRLTTMEGWAWAKPVSDMPAAWRHFERNTPKADLTVDEKKRLKAIEDQIAQVEHEDEATAALDAERDKINSAAMLRAFTSRQKAKSGCVVFVTAEGRLGVEAGVILPAETKQDDKPATPAKSAGTSKDEPAPVSVPRISNSQASELAVTLTEAAALGIAGNFNLAMSAALAALASNGDGLPVRMRHHGMGSDALKLTNTSDFGKNLATFLKMKPQQREALFAQIVAAALKFDSFNAERHAMTNADTAALVNAFDPKVIVPQILKRFDPEQYFDRAPKSLALVAIGDVMGKGEADFSDSSPKGECVTYALANVPPAKWLPVELRPAGYAGPGAKKLSTAKAGVNKVAAKAKGKRK